ncbi:LANO_0G17348g1_1 [Lachancea nothofagi CBS 11611]|uniref:Required for respiratory growth protein 7, mitochondrial n=1 Tax=Lachancea nothofagi CBS 11611 TaxID=1266666 RepID=A0A1G4KKF4_9SACH|nr:LANO_0G17348g1_1 [Lachancea nothofagi CBS 11611]
MLKERIQASVKNKAWSRCCFRSNHNLAIRNYVLENAAISGSTVFQGTLYEHLVVRELSEKLAMEKLVVCGGSYDAGIDIRGKWPLEKIYNVCKRKFELDDNAAKKVTVAGASFKPIVHKLEGQKPFKPLNVLVQCKAFTSAKITGKEVRETMGAFSSAVPSAKKNQYMLVLSSPNFLTRDGLNVMNGLAIPLVYVRVELLKSHQGWYDIENSGKLQNYYENEYASKLLRGCGVMQWLKFREYKQVKSSTA